MIDTLQIVKDKLRPVILMDDADKLVAAYLQCVDEHGLATSVMALDELLEEDEKQIKKDGILCP